MYFIKSIPIFCLINIKKWLSNPRMYIILILLGIIIYIPSKEVVSFSYYHSYSVAPWLFTFIFSTQFFRLLLLFGVVLLFCDAPFIDSHQLFLMVRSNRRIWVGGQILYIIVAQFIYLLIIYLFSILVLLPKVEFIFDWGKIIKTLSANDDLTRFLYFSKVIVQNYTPTMASIHTFMLNWALGVVFGILIFILNSLFRRTVGAMVVVGIILSSLFSGEIYNWICPAVLTQIEILGTSMSAGRPTLLYAYLYFMVSIVVLTIISYKIGKTLEITVLSTI